MATGININDFKVYTEFLAKKSGKGDYATPSQFNIIVNQALMQFIDTYSGDKSLDAMDNLRLIRETRRFLVDSNYEIGIPDGTTVVDVNNSICPEYMHWKSLRSYYVVMENSVPVVKEYNIDVVSGDNRELGLRLVSQVNTPTKKFPVAQLKSGKFKIFPKGIQYVVMDYTRKPLTANWNSTSVNGRPVYDAVGSVDIELPIECQNELAMMYLSYLGINMRDGELINYAEMEKSKRV